MVHVKHTQDPERFQGISILAISKPIALFPYLKY